MVFVGFFCSCQTQFGGHGPHHRYPCQKGQASADYLRKHDRHGWIDHSSQQSADNDLLDTRVRTPGAGRSITSQLRLALSLWDLQGLFCSSHKDDRQTCADCNCGTPVDRHVLFVLWKLLCMSAPIVKVMADPVLQVGQLLSIMEGFRVQRLRRTLSA